ncbi:MAG: hypothetical protein JNM00_13920, partial [Flavobacteriales bacterium]|nr:hypothetical protein [Flavobacteriales bacterium]
MQLKRLVGAIGLCAVLAIPASGQTYFQAVYGSDQTELFVDLEPLPDGTLLMLSKSWSDDVGYFLAVVSRMNTNGDTIWSITLDVVPVGELVINSNSLYFTGVNVPDGKSDSDIFLTSVSLDGAYVWSKSFGTDVNEAGGSLLATSDGGFLIAGITEHSEVSNLQDIFVVKTDSNGTIQWTKRFHGSHNDWPLDVIETNDGGYFISAGTHSVQPVGVDMLFIKTQETGDTLWTRVLDGSYSDQGFAVAQRPNGTLCAAGRTSSFGPMSGCIVSFDTNGNLLSSKMFQNADSFSIQGIAPTADGGLLISGIGTNTLGNSAAVMAKTNEADQWLWANAYNFSAITAGESVSESYSGACLLGGNYIDSVDGTQDVFIALTDAMGESGCSQEVLELESSDITYTQTHIAMSVTAPGSEEDALISTFAGFGLKEICTYTGILSNGPPTRISVFPNPCSDKLWVSMENEAEYAAIVIYDITGRTWVSLEPTGA